MLQFILTNGQKSAVDIYVDKQKGYYLFIDKSINRYCLYWLFDFVISSPAYSKGDIFINNNEIILNSDIDTRNLPIKVNVKNNSNRINCYIKFEFYNINSQINEFIFEHFRVVINDCDTLRIFNDHLEYGYPIRSFYLTSINPEQKNEEFRSKKYLNYEGGNDLNVKFFFDYFWYRNYRPMISEIIEKYSPRKMIWVTNYYHYPTPVVINFQKISMNKFLRYKKNDYRFNYCNCLNDSNGMDFSKETFLDNVR